MAFYEIPLVPGQQRTFNVDLAGVTYKFRTHFAFVEDGGWFLDIADAQGNPLVCGIAMVTGADILEPYSYLGIRVRLFVRSDGSDPDATPTFDGLGLTSHLYFEPF